MKGGYFQEVLVNNKDERNNPEMDEFNPSNNYVKKHHKMITLDGQYGFEADKKRCWVGSAPQVVVKI